LSNSVKWPALVAQLLVAKWNGYISDNQEFSDPLPDDPAPPSVVTTTLPPDILELNCDAIFPRGLQHEQLNFLIASF
jgi:hypothetical protein